MLIPEVTCYLITPSSGGNIWFYHTMTWYTDRLVASILLVAIISYSLAFTPQHQNRQPDCSHTHHHQPHHTSVNSHDHTHQLLSAITNTRGGDIQDDQPTAPSIQPSTPTYLSPLEDLLSKAQIHLLNKDADGAFNILAQAFGIDPTSSKVSRLFEQCLGLKVELAEEIYYTWKDSLGVSSTSNELVDSSEDSVAKVVFTEQQLNELFQDRMGLATLYIDREYYDEAGKQLRLAIEEVTYWLNHHTSQEEGDSASTHIDFSSHWQPQIDRAQYLLYRTNAACCQWTSYFEDGDRVRQSLLLHGDQSTTQTLVVHPFDALKFPCISLELASNIAQSYANRALETVGVDASSQTTNNSPRRRIVTANRRKDTKHNHRPSRKIRIGYISPDFTSKHPLAFLMQHVFRCHDKNRFTVNIYSVSSSAMEDIGGEVRAIRESSDQFTYLSPSTMSPMEMYQCIVDDEVDILVDLCGYAGTSVVSEILASRCRLKQDTSLPTQQQTRQQRFPMHVSYMGFPGSVGSSKVWDYSVFDPIAIPPEEEYGIRKHYKEALVYMPHCYFVNSHKSVIGGRDDGIMLANDDAKAELRAKYGIESSAFVYCCHSRPDKIDPSTFRSWMSALSRVRSADTSRTPVLWLLRSGDEMEHNLRQWVCQEFGKEMEDCLVFADVADRNEHLRRLGIADVFLDTPAYNAHTLGCDALYMGVPMISLLHGDDTSRLDLVAADVDTSNSNEMRSISTDKLASRVGASLLNAIGLNDLVYPTMTDYEEGMIRSALDEEWFSVLCQQLEASKDSSPLFDTTRWVENLESAFDSMVVIGQDNGERSKCYPDIVLNDDTFDRG